MEKKNRQFSFEPQSSSEAQRETQLCNMTAVALYLSLDPHKTHAMEFEPKLDKSP